MSEWALDRIEHLKSELEGARVEGTFWKRACERALELLFAQEDVSEALRAKLIEACNIGRDCMDGYYYDTAGKELTQLENEAKESE